MHNSKMRIIASILFVSAIVVMWLGVPAINSTAQAQGGTLYTTLVAQNMDAFNPMNARLMYSNLTGSPVLTTTHTIQPYRALTVNQQNQPGLPTSFTGSAIIDSDLPFGAFVYQYNGLASALGKNFRVDAYNASSSVAAATEFVFPQLLKNIYDGGTGVTYNSTISIQNTSAANASVTIRYKNYDNNEYVHSGIMISPGSSYLDELSTDSALANVGMFYGTARITSTQPIATVAHQNAQGILNSYVGLSNSNAGTTIICPQLLKNLYDPLSNFSWSSGIVLMSLDGTAANVTMTYRKSDGSTFSESQTASPQGGFDLRYSSALATQGSFYGSGVITSNKPIVAVIATFTNNDATRGLRSMYYPAFPSTIANSRVATPMLRKSASDSATGVTWSTSVLGQLVGNAATTVTLTYYLTDGSTLAQTASASPTAPQFGFDQRYFSSLPNGSVASAVLTTNPPQPIVAIIQFAADAVVPGDAAMAYEGIGY